ncbi:MAG: excinuclease ABC subunit UvrA [Firmicutes bacterium]|nr:excinuclease ABC subunit UvrA [Bacillota bacterium]
MRDRIFVRGARQHNLKNIDVEIPRDKLVVITGLSGSGKSSLAMDTIYAEGQRRYVESLSAYARQFLGQMDKPDVDYIEGLSPAISIDQKSGSRNPRSTVATVTEVWDYLRLLFARIGQPHCPSCGRPISRQAVEQMVDRVMGLPEGTRIQILAPLVRGRKGEHTRVFEDIRKAGYLRARVDGEVVDLSGGDEVRLEKNRKHTIEAVVDRLIVKPGAARRLADSLEPAVALSGGLAVVGIVGAPGAGAAADAPAGGPAAGAAGSTAGEELLFSQNLACPDCGISIEEIAPRLFSFNSPYGACPSCTGLGNNMEIDPDLVIPDRRKSLADGAIAPWSKSTSTYYYQMLETVAREYGFSMEAPVEDLAPEQIDTILYGTKGRPVRFLYENEFGTRRAWEAPFEGVVRNLERRYRESTSEAMRQEIEEYMSSRPCPACKGLRLKPEALAVKIAGLSIADVARMSVSRALKFFDELNLDDRQRLIAHQILKEIRERLTFMVNVGLDYLTLDRSAGSLAGGEAQRIRLATQIGSGLMGVLYILDEPSIGLHQRDNYRLLSTLKRLRDLGNTLIVVEHDEDTMWESDHVIDIGPGAGEHGGRVVASGTVRDIIDNPASVTGRYLGGVESIPVPGRRREPDGRYIVVKGAREHNLKGIDVEFPLGMFVCVTGVSGSGKSTLVNEILYRKLANEMFGSRLKAGEHEAILGLEHLDKVIEIDQSPIGRTPRSNPATYTGAFDPIREMFAVTQEARARGYRPGRFSFNVRGGRCEACRGDGIIKIEMHFLPDVYVPCEVCKGARYNRETLEVKYKGKNISQVLDMTVEEALEFFANIPKIQRKLQTMHDVGLGYIRLGQPATTLSGGEAQRVKLATELCRRGNGRTMYILDEPTTGLHFADTRRLLEVLQRLVDAGSTVVVIEHNMDVIKTADYIIDLGPEGGDQGGRVIAEGTPEQVASVKSSYTGQFLKVALDPRERRRRLELAAGGDR